MAEGGMTEKGGLAVLAPDNTVFGRFLVLVAAILLPMLVLVGLMGWRYADAERRVIEVRRADVAANASFLVDGIVEERLGSLQALSTVLSQNLVDLTQFHALAAEIGSALGEVFTLTDRGGQQVLSTRVGYGADLPRSADTAVLSPVFEERQNVISDVITWAGTNTPLVTVNVPVVRDGAVIYALSVTISMADFATALGASGLAPDWIAGIVDRQGVYLARSRDASQYLGRKARSALVAIATSGEPEGTYSSVTYEGIPVENSFRRSTLTGWTVVIAVPTELLGQSLRRARFWISLGFVVAVILAVGLAALTGRTFISSVRKLQNNALSLARGEPIQWSRHTIAEFSDIDRTLAEAETIIKERDNARAELVRTSALLETIIAVTPDLVYVKDTNSRTILTNPAALKLYGRQFEEVKGRQAVEWHADKTEVDRICHNDRLVMEKGESMQFEEPFTGADGTRIFLSTKTPLRDETGRVIGIAGVSTDVTERENRARHVEFIMRELSHRSKNLLTVIQSIARQTAKQSADIEVFLHAFDSRLQSLAALHDILVRNDWRGAAIGEIIASQIEPFAREKQFRLDGPALLLKPDVAQLFAMVFHELTTNAAKYGALSVDDGHVDVTWSIVGEGPGKVLSVRWAETGGPTVAEEPSSGFGSIVLKKIASQVTGARITYDFRPLGVTWELVAPLDPLTDTDS
jgi:PAS domain S-box-containing protein